MKFDFVIGNPPYQLEDNGHFFRLFINKAKTLSNTVAMVIPCSYFNDMSNFIEITHANIFFPEELYQLPLFTKATTVRSSGILHQTSCKRSRLKIEDVLGAVGRAIKGITSPKKNPVAIRKAVLDNFGQFKTPDDAIKFVTDMLTTA